MLVVLVILTFLRVPFSACPNYSSDFKLDVGSCFRMCVRIVRFTFCVFLLHATRTVRRILITVDNGRFVYSYYGASALIFFRVSNGSPSVQKRGGLPVDDGRLGYATIVDRFNFFAGFFTTRLMCKSVGGFL